MSKKRIEWIDVAKAIGIIAVVLGHSLTYHGTLFHTLYWWHMPIFFIMGGFFLKPVKPGHWPEFFKKRIYPLLISYAFCGTLVIMVSHFLRNESWKYTLFYFVRLVYGGQTLNHYTSVFWYINVYLLTILFVTFLITYIQKREFLIIVGFLSLIVGTSYKHIHFLNWKYTPWDFDVVLIVTFFVLFGYLYFKNIQQIVKNLWFLIPATMITLWLVFMQYTDRFNFGFFLKSRLIHASYHHIALSRVSYVAIIPILVCLVVFGFCYYLSEYCPQFIVHGLQVLGQQTLGIMYLHKILLDVSGNLGVSSPYIRTIIALAVSFILSYIYMYFLNRIRLSRMNKVARE
ncbi:acyltransferase family protein [Lentilactobacillus sp. SPB1-3]|uniref:Acyltransferase family protein n=1 Tax=Lentilactobacillus terminaliae TaxID=3003483 RepID=A0ACD5DHD7_9LACO|nr:acyltransferase family protein [Lentilactobacillus sp. SPB1-3]MCZ0977014.1 acyltransferase family protein [Lentilactobacillus sp. SPB1-3]